MPRMSVTSADHAFMSRALQLAQRGLYTTTPNPRVGCVVVRDGQIVGEGWHERAGEAHAEVMALRAAGDQARGATVYVSLEPCSHHGRTPPCADALVSAGVARVVAAMRDPNPKVAGAGLDAPAGRGDRDTRGSAGRAGARDQHRLRLAHAARAALAAREGGGEPGRPHRARQRREPVDHRSARRAATGIAGGLAPVRSWPGSGRCSRTIRG